MAERARGLCATALWVALAAACNTASAGGQERGGAADGPAPPAAPGAAPSCGAGQAECPTQRWMKANLQAFQRSRDHGRLAAAFEQLAGVAPDGFAGWAESARQGAEAAARKDEAGVSRSCETCHRAHREAFRRSLRSRALL